MFIASLIVFQVIIFIGLIYFLQRILGGNVVSATRHLDELNRDYDKKERELARQIEEIKQKSESTVSKARSEAESQKTQIIKETEAEREKILAEARAKSEETIKQADRSRQALLSELEDRISREAITKACELIENTLPEEFKQNVHSLWIGDLIANGFNQMENLNISGEIKEVKIISAFPLNTEQRKDLFKRIKSLLGHDIALKEEVDPKIVAGIVVTIGSLVLDGSLRNKIQGQANDISQKAG